MYVLELSIKAFFTAVSCVDPASLVQGQDLEYHRSHHEAKEEDEESGLQGDPERLVHFRMVPCFLVNDVMMMTGILLVGYGKSFSAAIRYGRRHI